VCCRDAAAVDGTEQRFGERLYERSNPVLVVPAARVSRRPPSHRQCSLRPEARPPRSAGDGRPCSAAPVRCHNRKRPQGRDPLAHRRHRRDHRRPAMPTHRPDSRHPHRGARADPRPRPHHQQCRPRDHPEPGRAPHRTRSPVRHRRRAMGPPRPPHPYPRAAHPRRDQRRRGRRSAGISADAVYYWIKAGHLSAHRRPGNRLAITWNAETEAACRARIASSGHLTPKSQPIPAGGAV
jgi:hypothetical protein